MAGQAPNRRPRRKRPTHHAADFDLDVLSGDDDLFRWFLLCFLLGKPIQSTVAVKTWQLFIDRKIDFPWAILETGDRQLVSLLHRGGYTRYQHVMSRALKTCMQQLVDYYEGSLQLMIESSENETNFPGGYKSFTVSARKPPRYSCAKRRNISPSASNE